MFFFFFVPCYFLQMENVKQELKMRARQQLPLLTPRCSLRAGNPHVFVLIPNQRNCFFWVEIWKSMTSCQIMLSSVFPVPPAELSWNYPGFWAGTKGCGWCQQFVLAAGPGDSGAALGILGLPDHSETVQKGNLLGLLPKSTLPKGPPSSGIFTQPREFLFWNFHPP